MFRVLTPIIFAAFLFVPQVSYACSCFCEYNQKVSEYMENKVVFWGIPKNSEVKQTKGEQSDFNILSNIVVLESYDQKLSKIISIESSPEDGGMCGFQPRLGIPQLITAYPSKKGYSGFSRCTCEIPPKQLFDYLEKGKDTFIPNPQDCQKDNKIKECDVWKNEEESNDLLWGKTLEFFPYNKHTEKLFSDK